MNSCDNNSSETNYLFDSFFDNPKIRQVLNDPALPVSLSCTRLFCSDLNRKYVFLLACSLLNSKFYIHSGRIQRPIACV